VEVAGGASVSRDFIPVLAGSARCGIHGSITHAPHSEAQPTRHANVPGYETANADSPIPCDNCEIGANGTLLYFK
jgi:hypothetical protein